MTDNSQAILAQLHACQEELERLITESAKISSANFSLAKAISVLAARDPGYWYFERCQVVSAPEDNSSDTQWLIENVVIEGNFISQIRFHTCTVDNKFGIIIHHPFDDFLKNPKDRNPENTLICIPEPGNIFSGNNRTLTNLSSSSWKLLTGLLACIAHELDKSAKIQLDPQIEMESLKTKIAQLSRTLLAWPDFLRFDSAKLCSIVQTNIQNRLDIRLTNASYNKLTWNQVNYGIGSVDPSGTTLGENLRIEFPESSVHSLENWHPETVDSRGRRLELRFAQPFDMDTKVWSSLSNNDHILIVALIASFSNQLEGLVGSDGLTLEDTEKWDQLGKHIKRILGRHLTMLKP
ncbi:hypothetical protein ACU7AI_25560 [Pseudomonas aeruginosa]|nr:hypothetical protein [Pseudomonas putida]